MSIPEKILQAGCDAYCAKFLNGLGSLGDGIEAAYLAIHEHADWVRAGPAAWTGEGLPPVGTVCEFAGGTNCPEDPFDKDLKEGDEVTIIAHFKDGESELAAFTFNPRNLSRGNACVEQGMHGCFRPIRTPEQVAADDRQKGIEDLGNFLAATSTTPTPYLWEAAQKIYDAGYRKQVPE